MPHSIRSESPAPLGLKAMTVLLIARRDDEHLSAISTVLMEKGVDVVFWETGAYPANECRSIDLSVRDKPPISVVGPDGSIEENALGHARSVWLWQAPEPTLSPELHPEDRAFVERECQHFNEPLFSVLDPDAFWVNPAPSIALANHVGVRFVTARQVGMKLPPTLFSNDPDDILEFFRAEDGEFFSTAFENQTPPIGRPVSDGIFARRAIHGDRPSREELRSQPRMYQAIPSESQSVVVVVMGRHAFGFAREELGDGSSRPSFNPVELSPSLGHLVQGFMSRLSLQYGVFDFLVSSGREPLFMGFDHQSPFLWVEEATGFPLLDAFSSLLYEGDPNFSWNREKAKYHYEDLVKS